VDCAEETILSPVSDEKPVSVDESALDGCSEGWPVDDTPDCCPKEGIPVT
jgi:hypothetical protein